MAKGKIEAKHTEVILVLASKWRKPYKVLILQGKLPSPNLEKVVLLKTKSCPKKKDKADFAVDIVFRMSDDPLFLDTVKLLKVLTREQLETVHALLQSLIK